MYKIAITGGIGSGKSVVANILRDKGYNVLSCDEINAEMLTDSEYLEQLKVIFPTAVCGNMVEKSIIREEIIHSDSKRHWLNALAHAEIRKRLNAKMKDLEEAGVTVAFAEVPLLFETNMNFDFTCSWLVVTDTEVRASRIMERDNVDYDGAINMMLCQMSDQEKMKRADYIIYNNGNISALKSNIDNLLDKIRINY